MITGVSAFSHRICAKLGKNNVNLQAGKEINSLKINEYEKENRCRKLEDEHNSPGRR